MVEPYSSFTPVADGQLSASPMAKDVSKQFLNLFLWGFIINIAGIIAFLSGIGFMFASAGGNLWGKTASALTILVGGCTYACGMFGLVISIFIIRYQHAARICSGDYGV